MHSYSIALDFSKNMILMVQEGQRLSSVVVNQDDFP